MKWPAIPKVIQGAGGPIRVRMVNRGRLRVNGKPAYGSWDEENRIIRLERGLPAAHRQRVFYHELTHAALHDSGLRYLLTPESEEALCDAMASARIAEINHTGAANSSRA